MHLSIVTTLYKSKPFLDKFIEEIEDIIQSINVNEYEIIFVNDGSPDDSLDYLKPIVLGNDNYKLVDLSRNFGHHYAMQAGLSVANGELIYLVDNDLETPARFLKQCYESIVKSPEYDVVYGYQETRKGKSVERLGGKVFWWMLNKLSDTKIPSNILTERIMTRKYLDSLLSLQDHNLFLGGMMYWVGYNQKGIAVKKSQREGASTYSPRKRLDLMIQAVSSFSGKPLEYLFYFGLIIVLLSSLVLIILLILKLVFNINFQVGWTSLIAINFLILGIISTFLGLIGIYLFKIFNQVQGRPNFIIKDIYE